MNNKAETGVAAKKDMTNEAKRDDDKSKETLDTQATVSGCVDGKDGKSSARRALEAKDANNLSRELDTLADGSNKHPSFETDRCATDDETAYVDEYAFLEGRRVGKYRVTKSLGSGSSSRVKMGVCLDTGEKVAIKIVKREYDNAESKQKKEERIYREVLISSLLSHPHIVRLKNFYFNENYFFLVFEYVKGMQLLDLVLEKGALPENESRRYFRQILSAISYIHENCIVHRDLKIENILIDEFGSVKILDFGLSNFFDYRRFLSTFCGSLYFAAPELLSGKRYIGPEIDIWSLGVILFVLLQGRVPFDDKNLHNLHVKIKESKLDLNNSLSDEANALLLGMISNNTSHRFNLQTVIDSAWVNINYNSQVDNFMFNRKPISKIDDKLITILSIIAHEQFPMLKSEIEKYMEAINDTKNGHEREFWAKKPSIALYYLLQENFQSNSSPVVIQQHKDLREIKDDRPESMHNFVNFLFSKEKENVFSKYFLGSVFTQSESSPFLPEKTISLKDEFRDDRTASLISAPKIKKSFVKGLFNGINVRNMKCQYQLRNNLQTLFMMNNILYEILDRHYVCSKGRDNEFCSFKVSLYKNIVFGNFYLSVTRIAGDKSKYKTYYSLLADMAQKGANFV